MKRTNQFERTDRDIIQAFLIVLDKKAFEKVTIADIIEEAMINRSTFYQHFTDKYAILERLIEKYAAELLSVMNSLAEREKISSFQEMDYMFETYFTKNKRELCKLLRIRTEHIDLQKTMQNLICQHFKTTFCAFSELELEMLSSLWMTFFLYYLEHDIAGKNFPETFFHSYFNITLSFFQMNDDPKARKEFLRLIGKHTGDTE